MRSILYFRMVAGRERESERGGGRVVKGKGHSTVGETSKLEFFAKNVCGWKMKKVFDYLKMVRWAVKSS